MALPNARAAIYEGTVCTTVKDSAWDNVWLRVAGPCQHVPADGPVYRYHDTIAERCVVRQAGRWGLCLRVTNMHVHGVHSLGVSAVEAALPVSDHLPLFVVARVVAAAAAGPLPADPPPRGAAERVMSEVTPLQAALGAFRSPSPTPLAPGYRVTQCGDGNRRVMVGLWSNSRVWSRQGSQ